jgi:hypothetical protein
VNFNTFIADLGASAHMVHSKSLVSNFNEDMGTVTIGDKIEVKSLGTGTFVRTLVLNLLTKTV